MGASSAWLSGAFDAAPARVDPLRTVLVSDFEPPAGLLVCLFGAPPRTVVLPAGPERLLPGVAYHTFRTNTNPILWDDAVDDALRGGADTVAFLIPPHEVRGRALLRLRSFGVSRVLLPGRGAFRASSPRLLALWRQMETWGAAVARGITGRAPDAMTEADCRAVLAQAPPLKPAPREDRPLRVAHFITSLNAGGAERQVCNAAISQKHHGLNVRVLSRFALVGDDAHYADLLAANGVPVRRAGARWSDALPDAWRRHGPAPALFRLLPPELRCLVADAVGELLTDPVDVLHCYVDDCNVAGLVAAALTGTAAVVSFRNGIPTNFPGLFRPWMRPLYRAAAGRQGLALSANSDFGARDYEDWLGLPAGSTPVIRNSFEPPQVPPRAEAQRWRRDLGLAADAPVVAGVFRLSAEKRPLFFLECIDRLRRRVPGLRAVLAGVGPLEGAVRAAVAERGLGETVRLLGRRADVPTILTGSEVLLLTSDMEGTSNVLLEAQHCGCVPVATDAGGSAEALRHGETGLLVGRDDLAGAVEAVAGLLADPVQRRRLAAAGPAFVAERFAPGALREGNMRLYRAALGGRRTGLPSVLRRAA
jgi:glycosyltransferase involved in cell wall biosynthesis